MTGEYPGFSVDEIRELRRVRLRALADRRQRLHEQKNRTSSVVLRDVLSEKMRELEQEMEALQ